MKSLALVISHAEACVLLVRGYTRDVIKNLLGRKKGAMSYFNCNGKKIYYEEHGSGEALILLHGNTVSGKFFMPVLPLFSEKYRVITLDFLGCGQSDRMNEWPADLWYEWSRQVVALCDELNLAKVKLIGCSGGALVAINTALEHPV